MIEIILTHGEYDGHFGEVIRAVDERVLVAAAPHKGEEIFHKDKRYRVLDVVYTTDSRSVRVIAAHGHSYGTVVRYGG